MLIFEAIIFSAAVYHGFKNTGSMKSLLLSSKGPFQHGPKPIMCLIFQGLVLYFILWASVLVLYTFGCSVSAGNCFSVLCSLPLMALVICWNFVQVQHTLTTIFHTVSVAWANYYECHNDSYASPSAKGGSFRYCWSIVTRGGINDIQSYHGWGDIFGIEGECHQYWTFSAGELD